MNTSLRIGVIAIFATLIPCSVLTTAEERQASDEEAEKGPMEYIEVQVQGKLMTGIFAIGGETTGTMIFASDLALELEFGDDKELAAEAKKLNGEMVLVTGRLAGKKGFEIPLRYIISVESLAAASASEKQDETE